MAIDSDDWLLKGSLNTINDILNKDNAHLDALCFHRYDPIKNKIDGLGIKTTEVDGHNLGDLISVFEKSKMNIKGLIFTALINKFAKKKEIVFINIKDRIVGLIYNKYLLKFDNLNINSFSINLLNNI